MQAFFNGLSAGAAVVAGVLFLRFWRETRERLFLWFALAFWMFSMNWTAVSLLQPTNEGRYLYFLPRLAGFVLILIAIVDKNRART